MTETRSFDFCCFAAGIELVGASTQLNWTYTTDDVGNILGITDALDAANNRSFTYDPVHYYLECAAGPWSPGSDCDPLTGQPYLWTYDEIGNRESEMDLTGAFNDYIYEAGGSGNSPRLDKIDPDPPGGIIYDYSFDAVGNQTQVDRSGNVIDFAYDDAGRLASVERTAAGERVDFSYDGRSFLSQAAQPGAFFRSPVGDAIFSDGFESGDLSAWSSCVGGPGCGPPPPLGITLLYDSNGLLHRITDQDGNPDYVFYLAGRPVAQMTPDIQDEIWTFLTSDHLGTPVMASHETGQTLWQGGFEPFGRDFADARGAGIFLRLPGQWWDPVWEDAALGADLYYNVHRWYEYGTGRYTRVDPVQWRGSTATIFNYAENQPLLFVDRLGLAPVKNNSGTFIPYKPEDGSEFKLCAPGDTCDADGVFPPSCRDFPIKIVNGCTGEVTANGKLVVWCPLLLPDEPGLRKLPALGQLFRGGRTNERFHRDHPDWPIPNDKPFCGCEVPSSPLVSDPGNR